MKIAIIPTTGGEDPFRGMDVAVELGVQGVHIAAYGGGLDLQNKSKSERAAILQKIRDKGLEVSALIGWGGNVDFGEEEGYQENIEWGKQLNEVAVDMSGGLWMAHVGIMPEDDSHPKWEMFVNALGQIAEHGEKVGAVLALETGPEPPVVVKRMMEEINSPALRVNFDPANLLLWPPVIAKRTGVPFDYQEAMRKFDPVEGLRTLIPYVAHVHGKDSVLRPDGSCEEVPLGTGMTNWPELYRIFVANNYEGFIAIERECGEKAMEDVRKAVHFLRELERTLGA